MRSTAIFFFALIAGTAAMVLPPRLLPRIGGGSGDEPMTLRMVVWGMPFEDRLFEDQYARRHEELNPGVHVDYQRHSDVIKKYNAWHAKGEGAEVMRMGMDYYHQFVERGMLEPLDDFMALPSPYGLSPEEMAAFPADLIKELTIDDKLYGLPQDSSQYGLYFNKDIFDAYNAEHPNDPIDYPNAQWTWNDLRSAAKKLTKRNDRGQVEVSGIDMPIWAWPFINLFSQAGGQLWREDGLTTRINEQPGVEALEFMRTLVVEDKSWTPSFTQEQGSGPTSRFATGNTAMMYGGSWWVPYFETNNPSLNFAVAPVPRGRVQTVPCGMVIWAISSRAANKRAGWRMIHWLVLEQQMAAYWDALRVAPPANLKVLNSDAFRETSGMAKRDGSGNIIEGEYDVPPMPREEFEDRAAWLLHAWTPDPQTGETPSFVIAGRYQTLLQNELKTALETFLSDPAEIDPQKLLDDVARRVHQQIDRERIADGLPAVRRE